MHRDEIELAMRVSKNPGGAAGLVIEGAPKSVRARAQELYPWLPMSLVASSHFNSIGRIADVRLPILFLHARQDKKIPLAHGHTLFDAATSAPARGDTTASALSQPARHVVASRVEACPVTMA